MALTQHPAAAKLALGCVLLVACGGQASSDARDGGVGGAGGTGSAASSVSYDFEHVVWSNTQAMHEDTPSVTSGESSPSLYRMWSGAPGNLWGLHLFGSRGGPVATAWHFEDEAWTEQPEDLSRFALAGLAPNEPLSAGLDLSGNNLVRWDGSEWKAWPVPSALPYEGDGFFQLAIASRDEIWLAAGAHGAHWNGSDWNAFDTAPLTQLFARSATDVWGAGRNGVIEHFDGSTWSEEQLGTSDWTDIWASASDDAWAVAANGTIAHFDPARGGWNLFDENAQPYNPIESSSLKAIWGNARNNVWVVGDAGMVQHFDGQRWSRPSVQFAGDFAAVTGNEREVWVAGELSVLRGVAPARR